MYFIRSSLPIGLKSRRLNMKMIKIILIIKMITETFCIEEKPLKDVKFNQSIMAVGVPYYKLLLSLGNCTKDIIFEEQKAWGKVKYNRVLDIYYRSANHDILVSKVEIEVVLDNTDCSVYSKKGVGDSEFSATMFIPTRVSMIFYHLKIWTCSEPIASNNEGRQFEMTDNSQEKIEDLAINKSPLAARPIRPDAEPDHVYYDPDHNTDPVMFVHPNTYDISQIKKNISKLNATTSLPLNFAQFTIRPYK